MMGNTTVPFVEAAVERMFNADEVTSVVDLAKLECLKRKIVSLFFTNETYYSLITGLASR
jgi:hypothetical protein